MKPLTYSGKTIRRFFDPDYLCHEELRTYKEKRKREIYNVSASFDIETTSFYDDLGNKCGVMYCFVLGVNGKVIFGRTWFDFIDALIALQHAYGLSEKKVMPIYVHNLSFEFQFMKDRLNWIDVFATDARKPARALCDFGIEFRDSLILSGTSLEQVGKNLFTYRIEKLIGDLDYSKLRHPRTILTPKEWHYVENDGLVLMAYIQEEIEKHNGRITNIPMTKTGKVRKYLRNECYHGGQQGHGDRRKEKNRDFSIYRGLMHRLTLTKEEYIIALEAFQGGFTHANAFNVGIIHKDIASKDLSSAYPAAMVLNRYPMGKGTKLEDLSRESILFHLKNYACFFRIRIWGIKSKFRGDNFLSYSKCRDVENCEQDNGRIVKADYLETTMTGIDLDIIQSFYSMKKVMFTDFWYYPWGYLPRNFIKGVLTLYHDKTALKGVDGEEVNYALMKELLNACYGCSVERIDHILNVFKNGEWNIEPSDLDEAIEKYNNSPNRFNWFLWGCYVTAWVRKTIARSILELGDDFIYADTDSVKYMHAEKHEAYFERYNAEINAKIDASSHVNNIDRKMYAPLTKNGVIKPIGVFDTEEPYKRFCTLGAKRYFVEYYKPHEMHLKDGSTIKTPYSLTIAGVNKKAAIPGLIKKAKKEKKDIFEYFKIGFVFDKDMCGKNLRTYCDYPISGDMIDYRGVKGAYAERSFMHLEPTTYKLTTTEEYYASIYADEQERVQRRLEVLK